MKNSCLRSQPRQTCRHIANLNESESESGIFHSNGHDFKVLAQTNTLQCIALLSNPRHYMLQYKLFMVQCMEGYIQYIQYLVQYKLQYKLRPALQRPTWASRLYEWNVAIVTD